MEKIKIYKAKKDVIKFLMISSLIFFFLGIALLILALINGFNTEFPGGDWNSVVISLQGILFFFTGYEALKSDKYFIEWDTEKMNYFLPKTKEIQTVKFSDIKAIEIKLAEINFQVSDNAKTLNLQNVEYSKLREIKDKFEDLQNNLAKGDSKN